MDPTAGPRARLVQGLMAQGYLRAGPVMEAMLRVPRHLFLPGQEEQAYADHPLAIGAGQTISAPHMVAIMAEALDARPGMQVLEIGAGSGYHAAVVAELVGISGKVRSVEYSPALVAAARAHLGSAGYGPARVEVVEGDGGEGLPEHAPFDRIYLTCAAPEVPAPLLDQLKVPGRLLAPLGDRHQQDLVLVERTEEGFTRKGLGPCVFVPLLGKHGFSPRVS